MTRNKNFPSRPKNNNNNNHCTCKTENTPEHFYLTQEEDRRFTKHFVSLDNKNWEQIPEHQYNRLLSLGVSVVIASVYLPNGKLHWKTFKVSAELPDKFTDFWWCFKADEEDYEQK